MAKGANQKLKLLYLAKIFYEQTDELHGLTLQSISDKLANYEISADRKTLYQDFEELRHFGLDILMESKGRTCYYYLASRRFELPELKMLVDSVQSSKFITDRKSRDLIRKLESLVSVYEAKQLHRQVYLSGRIKSMNESVYYSIDKIHTAINLDKQLRFRYFQWNINKKPELKHGGAYYSISPWALVWNNEYYYMVAYDNEHHMIKHFRVDKMLNIDILDDRRLGKDVFSALDLPDYSQTLFGMYGGENELVKMECENHLAGVFIDRFGKDITMRPLDDEHFQVSVNVSLSDQFIGWVIGLGNAVRITGPETVVEKMKAEVRRLSRQYLD